jgi:hypothetical protein
MGQEETPAAQQTASLFDHLVGDGEHSGRNGEAERLGGLEVDDELEFRRLQHRQLGWAGALENLAGVYAGLTIELGLIGPIADQPTCGSEFRIWLSEPRRLL